MPILQVTACILWLNFFLSSTRLARCLRSVPPPPLLSSYINSAPSRPVSFVMALLLFTISTCRAKAQALNPTQSTILYLSSSRLLSSSPSHPPAPMILRLPSLSPPPTRISPPLTAQTPPFPDPTIPPPLFPSLSLLFPPRSALSFPHYPTSSSRQVFPGETVLIACCRDGDSRPQLQPQE